MKTNLVLLWLLIVPFLILQSYLLKPQKIVALNNDIHYLVPLYSVFKKTILEYKYLPLWQNKTLLGSPLLGDPQSLLSYPFNYLSVFLNLPAYFIIYLLFHLTISSFSMYYFSRKISKIPIVSSLLISFLYTFAPKMLSHLAEGHLSLVAVYSLFPSVLISFYFYLRKPRLLTALTLSLLLSYILTLYLTVFYYLLVALIFITAILLISRRAKLSKNHLIYTLLTPIFIIAFQLPQILAEIELWPQLSRSLLTFTDVAGPAYSWKQLIAFILYPLKVQEYPVEFMFYLGLPALTLAVAGFFSLKNKYFKLLILLALAFLLCYSFGPKTPVYPLVYRIIPGVSLFRVPSRLFFLITFMVSILSGLGYSYFYSRWSKNFANLLLFICVLDYLYVGNQIISGKTYASYSLPRQLYSEILQDTDTSYFRIYCTTACIPVADIAAKNIGLATGYNPIQLTNVVNYQQKMGGYQFASYAPILPPYQTFVDKPQPDSQNLSLMRVKYVISSYPLTDHNLSLLKNIDNFYLYKNSIAASRAFIKDGNSFSPVDVTSDLPGIIKLDLKDKGEVIVGEVFTPSWHAYQNGEKIKVNQYADIALSAVAEKGEIIYKYEPWGTPLSWSAPLFMYGALLILYLKSLYKL